MKIKKIILILLVIGSGILLYFFLPKVLLQSPKNPANTNTSLFTFDKPKDPQVTAVVNGISISKADFEKELAFKKTSFSASKQEEQGLEQEVLESLVDNALVLQYANSKKITVTEEEVAKRFAELTRSAGSEEKYLAKIKANYGISKEDYLVRLRMEVLKLKVSEDLKKPLIDYLQETKKKVRLEKAF